MSCGRSEKRVLPLKRLLKFPTISKLRPRFGKKEEIRKDNAQKLDLLLPLPVVPNPPYHFSHEEGILAMFVHLPPLPI
jgi:hypothetical protein